MIKMTDEIRKQIKARIAFTKYGTDEYFGLLDLLEVAKTNEKYPAEIFKSACFVICAELNGQAECHVFGDTDIFCPFAAIPLMDERLGKPECPLAKQVV